MDDFRTCSLHDTYHTGCIDCQHDMTEEISILKADNARMREALDNRKFMFKLKDRIITRNEAELENFHRFVKAIETIKKDIELDWMVNGIWVDNPDALTQNIYAICEQALKGEG